MVDEKRKTTVPIPPVGADGEQPILNNTTGIISGETPEINYLDEISEENFQEIQRSSGTQFDPEVVLSFLKIKDRICAILLANQDD